MNDTWLCRKCGKVIDKDKDTMGWMPITGGDMYGHRTNPGTSFETFCGPVTLEVKASRVVGMRCVLLREWTEEYRTSDDNYEPPEPDMNADGPAERDHRMDEARRMK